MDERHTNLQGTWAYSAQRLKERGDLAVGASISLRREPKNKHDSNAIAIYLGRSKIGFLPRSLAAEIASYLDAGGESRGSISHVGSRTYKGKTYPTVSVDLELESMSAPDSLISLLDSALSLSGVEGICRIKNRLNQKSYIGSSSNVGKRLARHIALLRSGTHHNQRLMREWNKHGPSGFEISLIERASSSKLREREKVHIEQLGTHLHGYNQTSDGGGASPLPSSVRSTLGIHASGPRRPEQNADPKVSREPHSTTQSVNAKSGCLASMLLIVVTGGWLYFP